jgi:hypothetical protein
VEWTVGAGIEGRINAAYTVKLEYLSIDLSSIPVFAALPANAPPFNSCFTDNLCVSKT